MKRFAAVLFVLGLSISVASAGTSPVPFGPVTGTAGGPDRSGSIFIPQFNNMGGTLVLDSVNLLVNGYSTGGTNAIENCAVGFTGTADGTGITIGSDITVSGPVNLVVITYPNQSAQGPIGPYDGTADYAGTDTISIIGTNASDTKSSSKSSSLADLSPYIGLGSVTLTYNSALNQSAFSDSPDWYAHGTAPTFSFDGIVTYTYHTVPEPATISMLVMGGLGLLRRRMRG